MKIYAKQISCDDSSIYMDDEGIFSNDIIIASKEYNIFYGFNIEGMQYIYKEIYNYSNYEVESYFNNNLAAYIIYKLKIGSYKKISLKQALKIATLLKSGSNWVEFFVEVFSAIKNKRYTATTIRGCCQGDYATLFYIKDSLTLDMVNYIEAVYFNTGFEIMIHDDSNIPNDPDSINGYTFYTAKYKDDDIKQEIANQFINTTINDVVLYWIEKTITIHKDIYKEVL